MNLPNTITLIRVVLIPLFIDLMVYGYYRAALAVFLAACVTDALDGMIARLTNTKTELGAFLDPLADKLLIVSSFVTLALMGRLPLWLVIAVVSRDVILGLGGLVIFFTGHSLTIKPSALGKMSTFLQFVVVTLTLVLMAGGGHTGYVQALYWATAAVTAGSGVQYVIRGMKIMA
jgi:cardiolipin synthase